MIESSQPKGKHDHSAIRLTGSEVAEIRDAELKRRIYEGSQQEAYDQIIGSLMSGNRWHVLMGYAGTGKTTMLAKFVAAMEAAGREVYVSATTNKAVAVIASKMPAGTHCQTVHKLIGRTVHNSRGKQILVPKDDRQLPPPGSIVIIDECSMIADDLFDAISDDLRGSFILFVGDPAQLAPVGQSESRVFTASVEHKSSLTKVMRQAENNPIISAASLLRSSNGGECDLTWIAPARRGNDGIFVLDHEARKLWIDKAFNSAEFADDPDAFRYLAWTNRTVDRVNRRIREKIYGTTATPFIEGEKAVANAPISNGTMSIANSEIVTVKAIRQSGRRFEFDAVMGSATWNAVLPGHNIVLEGDSVTIASFLPADPFIVTRTIARLESEAERFDDIFQRTNGRKPLEEENPRWVSWREVQEACCDVKHVYAMTVHKSQGSTFKRVFVDVGDIMLARDRDPELMNQLLYVAATRPSSALFLCNVPHSVFADQAKVEAVA